jgi:hypothetical protein
MATNLSLRKMDRPKLVRQRTPQHTKLIAPHALSVGKVLWEWNALHTALFRISWVFIGDGGKRPRDLPTEVWHLFQNDDHQRRLLSVYAEQLLIQAPSILKRIRWLLKTINEIAEYRNIATHVSMGISEHHSEPFITAEMDGLKRVKGIKLLFVSMEKKDFWEAVASDLYVLQQYADCLMFWLVAHPNERVPLPYKPRLLSLPTIRAVMIRYNQIFVHPKRRPRRRP